MPRYFNLPNSKVGNVNRTALTFFVFDPVDAMYATAYLFFEKTLVMLVSSDIYLIFWYFSLYGVNSVRPNWKYNLTQSNACIRRVKGTPQKHALTCIWK